MSRSSSEKKVATTESRVRLRENRVVEYVRDTWFELKKVSWPTRSEAVNLTIIVVSVTAFLSLVLGLMDWIFQTAFGLFL